MELSKLTDGYRKRWEAFDANNAYAAGTFPYLTTVRMDENGFNFHVVCADKKADVHTDSENKCTITGDAAKDPCIIEFIINNKSDKAAPTKCLYMGVYEKA